MVVHLDTRPASTSPMGLPNDYITWFCQEYNVVKILSEWNWLTMHGVYSAVARDGTVIGPCDSLETLAAMCRVVTS